VSTLELAGVTRQFGEVKAVDDVSLSVADGEFVVLLGPSGCGKTTTLRLLAGFERPDYGRISMDGRVLAEGSHFRPPEKRDISVVFQSYALWPHISVARNVSYGLEVRKVKRPEIDRRVREVLELVQLSAQADRSPHELSGGQQQRVALARALVTEPKTLLLDEPLSNLDTRLREEMRVELWRLQRSLNVTTVYVTHDQAEALSLADRVVVMREGRIDQMGTPEQIYRRPRTSYVARSLGPSNILPVTVGSVAGDRVDVVGPGGLSITALAPLDGTAPPAQAGVAVRPVDVLVAPDQAGNATVRSSLYFGTHVQMTLQLEGWDTPVSAQVSPQLRMQPGDRAIVSVGPDAAAVLVDSVARDGSVLKERVSASN
jgi:ABC-type Fe3+/spermidine/putrescine transport system ATPase subunit